MQLPLKHLIQLTVVNVLMCGRMHLEPYSDPESKVRRSALANFIINLSAVTHSNIAHMVHHAWVLIVRVGAFPFIHPSNLSFRNYLVSICRLMSAIPLHFLCPVFDTSPKVRCIVQLKKAIFNAWFEELRCGCTIMPLPFVESFLDQRFAHFLCCGRCLMSWMPSHSIHLITVRQLGVFVEFNGRKNASFRTKRKWLRCGGIYSIE